MKDPKQSILKYKKEIIINDKPCEYIDKYVINRKFYNAFNYSKLPEGYKHLNLTLGVTSAAEGEGKTLVASNLAVSFALGYQKRTVLVDLNLKNPSIHKVFGADSKPGLIESFNNGSIHLSQSKIESLYVLTSGESKGEIIGLQNIIQLRDVIRTLEREFDFVVVDMASISPVENFPVLFVNEVDGLLAVIETGKTKKEDLETIYQYVNERQIIGYVFNRFDKKKRNGRKRGR